MIKSNYIDQCDAADEWLAVGNYDLAIEAAHRACASDPGSGRPYRIIAAALISKEDFLSALETYEIAWLLDPNDESANEGVKKALVRLRNESEIQDINRPLAELSAFGFYSKACRRFLRVELLVAAARAGGLAAGENSDVLLKNAIMNIDATLCSWSRYNEYISSLYDYVRPANYGAAISPLISLCLQDDPVLHLGIAQKFLNDQGGHQAVLNRKLRPLGKLKVRPRIGYLSADFHDHATSRLIVGMLEAHDRRAWDIVGLSYGGGDGSAMRARLEGAFENFIDLHGESVDSNVQLIKKLNLDILIDAKGLTNNFEPTYSVSRPAPVLVNFLAYPGSMGSSAYDYIIGDRVVTPFEYQSYYSECIVQMPHAYQPNDPHRASIAQAPTRAEVGLPEDAFVLAAFNHPKKITPDHFQLWMRILRNLPRAVLWLYCTDDVAKRNIRVSAKQSGIDAGRLIFAPKISVEAHLARHQLADLFLDTFPYNAHTTASDALWMGLPVVTLKGKSFASRVAASLLEAVGLPQLAVNNINEYEDLVCDLANRPQLLRAYKRHLVEIKVNSPLFDARTYAADIEQAYMFMIERSRRGKSAHSFEVRSVADGGGVRLAGGRNLGK